MYFHLFLSNLGPNKAHMSSWDTSMFAMSLRSLLIPRNPWTSMKQCRSSFSSKPSDCPCNLRKTRIVKCQNKKNIGKKKCENHNVSPSVGNIHMMKPNQPNKQMMFAKVINPKGFLTPSVLELATKSIVEAMGSK